MIASLPYNIHIWEEQLKALDEGSTSSLRSFPARIFDYYTAHALWLLMYRFLAVGNALLV